MVPTFDSFDKIVKECKHLSVSGTSVFCSFLRCAIESVFKILTCDHIKIIFGEQFLFLPNRDVKLSNLCPLEL